ncbi:MAG TPA: 3-deoxy-D-manno-octulosonic acid kinase [Steroidobacteraceae bacterium]|nr:3-deoxy-D-manno-octulosonic acid kinase [Steroidobacteraceae bacterium]
MIERVAVEGGAILFDPERVETPDWRLFDRAAWRARGALRERPGGRGSIHFIDDGPRHWALRRYLRGGWAAHLARDRYLYLGEECTRPFGEFRLLWKLRGMQLPVPVPVAAGYRRELLTYRAELITERIFDVRSLAERVRADDLRDADWMAIGACLRRFHDACVHHADLNAHNVLLDAAGRVWVVDFDRGRIRERGAWPGRVLERLGRSLAKVSGGSIAWREGFAQLRAAHDA